SNNSFSINYNNVIGVSEIVCLRKIENSLYISQIALAKVNDDDNVYFYSEEKEEKEMIEGMLRL
ncbi:6906_t:CDS:2, partial [Funneliformis mosseae]